MTNSSTTQILPPIRENEFLPSVDRWLKFGSILITATLGLAIPLASTAKYKETVVENIEIDNLPRLRK
ncbi:MAG: hypothetical protein AAF298_28370 [Cyanobacteria bacterium P01_A01_bin.40]